MKIIQNYTKIIHQVNISQYEENIQKIQTTIKKSEFEIPNSLRFKLQHLIDEYQSLTPHIVHKRGLLNFLGGALKFITGTMDNDDAEDIANHFKTVQLNEHNIIKNYNKQIQINEQIAKELENITNHINENQNLIINKINNLQFKLNKLERKIVESDIIREISENIETVINHIKNIKEIVMLSRLEVLSRDLLTIQEIKENNITLENLRDIKICVALYNEILLFIIQVPNFTDEQYYKVHIEPIPNNGPEKLQIVTPFEYILTNNNNVYLLPDKNNNVLKHLKEVTDQCIGNIHKQKLFNCVYKKNTVEEIKQITPNIIITKNSHHSQIIQNCYEPNEIILTSNNIIKFENCKIAINNIVFKNRFKTYYDHVILPNTIKEIIMKSDNNLTLEQISHKNTKNLEEINEIKYQTKNSNWLSISMDITTITIIILVIVTLYIKFKKINTKVKIDINPTPPPTRPEPSPNEGGVIYKNKVFL